MVKKLRIKFMAVTMSLILIVFSPFWIISSVNDNYWNIIDTSNTLEWIAESGVFTNAEIVHDDVDVSEKIADEDTLIVGVITDENGKILSQQIIGKGPSKTVNQRVISKILSQEEGEQSYKSYVYTVKELNNGNKLIVLQDTSNKSNAAARAFGTVAMIILGVGTLALLTFFLSKFITEPAKKAFEREKQFVSDASHELKTPISAISINAQALNVDNGNIHIRNILSETERVNKLIEKLLTLSKMEETPLTNKVQCSLSDIINEIALTYESIAFEKEITYQYEIADGLTVMGDEDELKQLVTILIDNAIKNTESPGLITIMLKVDNAHTVFEVKNTGKGISSEDLPHIFERFYTRGNSRSDNSYGLGLPIAKSIVERHKGTITADSIIDEETVFTVVL
ncbi:MAG: HAMP domain-containing histidine kinase [Eubacterium sp.]|nr:HAMP domain-containing histidine kinase [Eubacterium sp.]